MATHSSILAWRIPKTEEPSRLQSVRLQRVGHNLATKQQHTFALIFLLVSESSSFERFFLRINVFWTSVAASITWFRHICNIFAANCLQLKDKRDGLKAKSVPISLCLYPDFLDQRISW